MSEFDADGFGQRRPDRSRVSAGPKRRIHRPVEFTSGTFCTYHHPSRTIRGVPARAMVEQ